MRFVVSPWTFFIFKAALLFFVPVFSQAAFANSVSCGAALQVAEATKHSSKSSYELALSFRSQGRVSEASLIDRIEETFLARSKFETIAQINPSVQIVKDLETGRLAIFKTGTRYPNIAALEVFAYKLDRYLGLGRAPVAIPTQYNGVLGVMISFVPGRVALEDFLSVHNFSESDHIAKTQTQANTGEVYVEFWNYLETWGREIHFFDLILANRDRHPQNVILLPDSNQTRVPIDFANSLEQPRFKLETNPLQVLLYGGRNHAGYNLAITELSKISPQVLSKYFALDGKSLDSLFPGLLTESQKEVFLAQQASLRAFISPGL